MKAKFMKNKFMASRYCVSSMLLVLCLVASQMMGVSSVAQAYNENIRVLSENAQANIVLDGSPPEDGKFEFQLLDSTGNILDTARNDSDGNVKFANKVLEKKNGNYRIKLLETDNENIVYGETSKLLEVSVKEVEKPGEAGPFDDAIGFVGHGVPRDRHNRIKVDYWVGSEKKETPAYCVNTDILLQPSTNLSAITDPNDEELSKWILSEFSDCSNRCSTDRNEVKASGYTKRYGKFVKHEYETQTNTVIDELKVLYQDDASNVLKKTVYYLDKFYNTDTERTNQMKSAPHENAQNLVWASCGGYFGKLRGFCYEDYERDKDRKSGAYRVTTVKSEVSSHVEYLKKKLPNINVPDNYHIILFVSKGNISQPLVFGYETKTIPNKKFKETWITVPKFEVTTKTNPPNVPPVPPVDPPNVPPV
ncbi:MAG: hypothetical protein ACTTKD_06350, partial [Peptoanaerobacter stomatis]|uniref:hypothetical protein n=1 Tax=Peptoanaerobacter stomatis TaxID=796937 RepID=UPI003F9FF87E